MAKRITDAGQQPRQRGELTFDDVPEHLRPSGFRYWLDRIPEHPDHTDPDHVVAAYGEDVEGTAELVAHHLPGRPPVDPHWRTQVAASGQWEAYVAWCAEHGLILDGVDSSSRGAVPRAWSWTELRRWEERR